jgi:tRNA (guanine-N7-)-methyltransferase
MIENSDSPPEHRRHIRSFVIRAGRMTAGQQRAWDDLWPMFGLEYSGTAVDFDRVFKRGAPRVLEIGFGTGDALLAYALQHPERDCIGIEVHPPGVGHLMLQVRDKQLSNVRVMRHDAVEVLTNAIGAQSMDEVHIFFPDPWHKKRHHKRRLIQPAFVDLLARAIKPSGVLKLATDWEDYAHQMRTVLDSHASFANLSLDEPHSPSGFAARAEHRPLTRFERRGHRLGHGVWDLVYRRK